MKKLLLCLLVISVFSCHKSDDVGCEQWEYRDECTPKSPAVTCLNYGITRGTICDDRLKDARAGRSSVITDNADIKKVRYYIKKVQ